MSAVAQVLAVVAVFREFGVPVTFEPGWENRGNGLTADYRGGIVHHTATGYSDRAPSVLRDGRPDLDGPLCQYAGLASGGIHVVCAHPANHAGASGGPRNGPFPVTTLFNRLVMGLEIVYPGVSPMTPAQYRTALVFAIAIRRLFGHSDYEWTRAHAETSREGKWDPGTTGNRTIDMDRFRRDAADLEASGGDDVSLYDETTNPVTGAATNFAEIIRWGVPENIIKGVTEAILNTEVDVLPGAERRINLATLMQWFDNNFESVRAQNAALLELVGRLVAGNDDNDLDEERVKQLFEAAFRKVFEGSLVPVSGYVSVTSPQVVPALPPGNPGQPL